MSHHRLDPSGDGGVILDIGGDIGALVLHASAPMLGEEIDLIPDDPLASRTHSAVRERGGSDGPSYAAVYPHVRAGTYVIEGTRQRVTILGGQVTVVVFDDAPGSHGAPAVLDSQAI